jgi:hypothetical protein
MIIRIPEPRAGTSKQTASEFAFSVSDAHWLHLTSKMFPSDLTSIAYFVK